jgi:lipoprotein-releasing system permease protein
VALISIISFSAVALAVFALITVMSVMNGFRAELLGRILGFNGHLYAQSPMINGPDRDTVIRRIKAAPGVTQAAPMVEAQAMVIGPTQVTGAIVRGVTTFGPAPHVADRGQHQEGLALRLRSGRVRRRHRPDRRPHGPEPGRAAGDPITLISPSGPATAFGSSTNEKDYIVGGSSASA